MATLNGTHKADTLNGTAHNDSIYGDNGNDVINGGAGDDYIDGGNGSDSISGGAGNDVIDGGNGQDTVVLAGKRSDYRVFEGLNGAVVVRDLRAGSPDGQDRLFGIERVQFSDGTFKLQELLTANVGPVAQNDSLTLSETAGKTEVTSILLANDKDADGDVLTVTSVQAVSARGAAVSIGPDGKVSYDPGSIFADLDNGETATDSFTYAITDGNGHTSTATATVTITGVTQNQAPVATADKLTLAENAGKTDVTASLLANDSDPDGDSFQVTSVQAVSARGAAVTVGPDGKVSYDSGAIFADLDNGETATDSFTYTITDSKGLTSTATATVTIAGITQNTAPAAADDALEVAEDAGPTDVTAILLANDSDPEGDSFQITSVQGVSHRGAVVTVGPDGKVSYDAGQIFGYLEDGDSATDHFTYTITDAHGLTSTATATVTITGVTQEPDAYIWLFEDGTTDNLLWSLSEQVGFTITGADGGKGTLGTVFFDGGVLTFTADDPFSDELNADMHHTTTFTVTGAEGQAAMIMAIVAGSNDEILAVDDQVAIAEGEATDNLWSTVLANEVDPDGFNLRIDSVDTAGTHGTVFFDAFMQTLTYSAEGLDLDPGEIFTDSFSYLVNDAWGSTDTATVFVTVTGGAGGGAGVSMSEAPMSAFGADSAAVMPSFHDMAALQLIVSDAVIA
ncbi:MAG TPA: Ig-like domain-containing protein [Allosphingosinicella sp.]|jgi:VCBS repeat-containing protein